MSTSRVLVTGATGFVGRWAVKALAAQGADVHTLQRTRAAASDVSAHTADIHDRAAVEAVVRQVRPSHLLHLAWIATPGTYLTSADNPRWLQSSLHLVDAFLAHGGQRVVVAGTAAEYDWRAGVCSERTTPCRPDTPYASSKHALYQELARRSDRAGFSFAEGHLFWIYGPGESKERLVPGMILASMSGARFTLRHPAQVRDYLHVADAGAAFGALLASDVQGPVNIGSGQGTVLAQLGELVGAETGRGLVLDAPSPAPEDAAPVVVADVTRLTREVQWTPRFGLTDGVRDTVAWWKAHEQSDQ